MTKIKTKRHYTPSAKQNALNGFLKAISQYTNLIEATNKKQIANLMQICINRGVTISEIAKACEISRPSVTKSLNQ